MLDDSPELLAKAANLRDRDREDHKLNWVIQHL